MTLQAFALRPEPLGILVLENDAPVHRTGDAVHRIATRTMDAMVVTSMTPHTHLRSLVALLALRRKVACVVCDEEDIERAAARLLHAGGAYLEDLETAVWCDGSWQSTALSTLHSPLHASYRSS